VILRFESRDDQVMSAGGQPEFRNALSSGVTENRRAVGNVVRRYRKPVGIVLLDPGRVGDQRIRPAHRERLGGPVVTLAGAIPFCPFPFEPVDMGRDRNPAQPQERKQGRVCRVEEKAMSGRSKAACRTRALCGSRFRGFSGAGLANAPTACRDTRRARAHKSVPFTRRQYTVTSCPARPISNQPLQHRSPNRHNALARPPCPRVPIIAMRSAHRSAQR